MSRLLEPSDAITDRSHAMIALARELEKLGREATRSELQQRLGWTLSAVKNATFGLRRKGFAKCSGRNGMAESTVWLTRPLVIVKAHSPPPRAPATIAEPLLERAFGIGPPRPVPAHARLVVGIVSKHHREEELA